MQDASKSEHNWVDKAMSSVTQKRKRSNSKLSVVFEDGEVRGEDELDFGGFGDDTALTEEEEAERLREERKKRRAEILSNFSDTSVAPNGVAVCVVPSSSSSSSSSSARPEAESHVVANGANTVVDDFDMFSDSPVVATGPTVGSAVARVATREAILQGDQENLQANWDDGEGYYKSRPGEVIANTYRILGSIGKGVFSTVLDCIDLSSPQQQRVAVKLIRNVDIMRKAAEKEVSILTSLRVKPDEERYCVAFLGHLEHRRHTVLVFEMMRMNLRETVKKYGSGDGINVVAVRLYAKQLFRALRHMAAHHVVHADIKPDNILVSDDLKTVKICDFGSAYRDTEPNAAEPTPYLVSRFYRAPEIILGLPYDRRLDLWSVATCIFESFTGKVMFPGSSNNDMLRKMMSVLGAFPPKLLKAHQRSYDKLELESHFTDDLQFKHVETDRVSGRPIMKVVRITAADQPLLADVDLSEVDAEDQPLITRVRDLLYKCLQLDPKRRISLDECDAHPLFKI